ncbi:MAG TPA: glutamate 5-kinase [Streptosporangiaceae bacterium]|jgi:glutamate 5-kinase
MKSIVVKLGSSSVTRTTGPDPVVLTSALDAALHARSLGWSVTLVTSGAVSSGAAYLTRASDVRPSSRLAAAVGQPFLMDIYRSVSEISGKHVCQILISEDDLRAPAAVASVCAVLSECADAGIVPIVNGNDVTDARGSDNDAVAVAIAVASGADKLLLLTDVHGVLDKPQHGGSHLPDLPASRIRGVRATGAGTGRGGMRSKLRAVELAAYNGIESHIANARTPGVITGCIKGEPAGTRIPPARPRFPADARWISGVAVSHGSIVINRAAEESIGAGASLFASGIKKVEGNFGSGDVIEVLTPSGRLIARGTSKVSATLMNLVRAMQTDEIALVMTEILTKFRRGNRGGQTGRPAAGDPPAAGPQRPPGLRLPVARALEAVGHFQYEQTRRLALEIINLFPAATVEAMLDAHRDEGLHRLRDRYSSLSSDFSFIDRRRLVTFSR